MNLLKVYEYTLGELNKREAPSILLEDFNYFLNKAIQQYVNKIYNIFELSQQQTDDLRILKKEGNLSLSGGVTSIPGDYRHMLSCIVNYAVRSNFKCFSVGDTVSYGAGRMTTDMQTLIRQNHYFKPTYFRPYYYITRDSIIIYSDKQTIFDPVSIKIEYLGKPTVLELTQDHLDLDPEDKTLPIFGNIIGIDTSSVPVYAEYPDYVQYEIINELVKLVMENASDLRVQTHIGVNQSIATQQQR